MMLGDNFITQMKQSVEALDSIKGESAHLKGGMDSSVSTNSNRIGFGSLSEENTYFFRHKDTDRNRNLPQASSNACFICPRQNGTVQFVPPLTAGKQPFQFLQPAVYRNVQNRVQVQPRANIDLFDFLLSAQNIGNQLSVTEIKYLFAQIVLAVESLHLNGYAHMDVKAENCLLTFSQSSKEKDIYVTLSDFAFVTKVNENGKPIDDDKAKVQGTCLYMDPRALLTLVDKNKKYSNWFANDLYGLGAILYHLTFNDVNDVMFYMGVMPNELGEYTGKFNGDCNSDEQVFLNYCYWRFSTGLQHEKLQHKGYANIKDLLEKLLKSRDLYKKNISIIKEHSLFGATVEERNEFFQKIIRDYSLDVRRGKDQLLPYQTKIPRVDFLLLPQSIREIYKSIEKLNETYESLKEKIDADDWYAKVEMHSRVELLKDAVAKALANTEPNIANFKNWLSALKETLRTNPFVVESKNKCAM